jgi:hypothetical protein
MGKTSTLEPAISPEAKRFVAGLGLEEPLRQMLEHVQSTVKELRRIQVNLAPPYDLEDGERVILDVVLPMAVAADRITQEFIRWQIEHFHPEVYQHFVLMTAYE